MFGYSKEHVKFFLTSKCPLCGKLIFRALLFKGDGTRISLPTFVWNLDRSAVAECPKCRQRWPVFATSTPAVSKQQHIGATMETIISEEPLGEEQRLIDNSKSVISLTRRFTISKEWSQFCVIEYEKAQITERELDIGINMAASIKMGTEEVLRAKYSISEETRRTYTEEIVLEVPAKTKVRVYMHWKRLWQHGLVKLRDQKNKEIEVPFKVVVGVTFDQTQHDEK